MTYLLGSAGAAGAFVPAGGVSVGFCSQPVSTAPATIPNNTISMNILFIVSLTFTRNAKRASGVLSSSIGSRILSPVEGGLIPMSR